jgi:multiple sugar transport system permease protein
VASIGYFRTPGRVIVFAIVVVVAAFWVVPVLASLVTSVRTYDDLLMRGFFAVPDKIIMSNFRDAWIQGKVGRYLINSFRITLPALGLTLFFSSLTAFALVRFRFPGNKVVYLMYVGGMLLPFQVLLLPVFRLNNALGIYDTHLGLIAFHTAFQLGFCTFVLRNYMLTVPSDILEAARIDGCREFRIYWRIMLPLTLPAMAALATLEFTWIFNDYLWAIVLLRTSELFPVNAGLSVLQGQWRMDWAVMVSGAILAAVPTIVVFIFLQRYFIQGLTLGSTKG